LAEFSLIDRYCKNIGSPHSATKLAVGDDAAIVRVPADKELAISVDTMVEGVHFSHGVDPAKLAHKLLAVNLSDMAAMGADPQWATLSLTIPSANHDWLDSFSSSLNRMACQYGVVLIGGDTTEGPLTLSLQILGLLEPGSGLTRAGAQLGDDIYVSGCLGDAALALAGMQERLALGKQMQAELQPHLDTPIPQVALGRALVGLATACIDVSDGLLADLSHICKQSHVSMQLDIEKIPLSSNYREYYSQSGSLKYALSGGDDYQLGFTVAKSHRKVIVALAEQIELRLTRIGSGIEQKADLLTLSRMGKPFALDEDPGFQHFAR
jgi:thiamine-monophosphate kinase